MYRYIIQNEVTYKLRIIGVIPARMESSRFPGKPLAKINGVPMIGHVYYRSKMNKTLNDLYVATCNKEIENYIQSIGGKTIMTSNTHKRASDRVAEALIKIENEKKRKIDIVVMIQGDEPMIHPEMIDEAVKPLIEDKNVLVSNLIAPLKNDEELNDPNTIKVVFDKNNFALYFSREPIPYNKKISNNKYLNKQVCIIPFKRDFLIKFSKLEPTPLEEMESIDMLRVLEHGYRVKLVHTKYDTYSVDTIKDLEKVESLMKNDDLFKKYSII